jgi:hypothetical protein
MLSFPSEKFSIIFNVRIFTITLLVIASLTEDDDSKYQLCGT